MSHVHRFGTDWKFQDRKSVELRCTRSRESRRGRRERSFFGSLGRTGALDHPDGGKILTNPVAVMPQRHDVGIEVSQGLEGGTFLSQKREAHVEGEFLGNRKMARLLNQEIDRLGDGSSRGVLDRNDATGCLTGTHSMEDLRDRGAGKTGALWITTERHNMRESSLGSEEGDGRRHGCVELCGERRDAGKPILKHDQGIEWMDWC